jgi:hypothetical protein
MPTRSVSSVMCAVCNNPVPLEIAGTDQDGNAVQCRLLYRKIQGGHKSEQK